MKAIYDRTMYACVLGLGAATAFGFLHLSEKTGSTHWGIVALGVLVGTLMAAYSWGPDK